MISGSWKLLSSVCVEACFGQAWKKWTPHKCVSQSKHCIWQKGVSNNNSSAQSHLGEHGPLKHDLLCLSLKWTHSKKRIVKVNMLIGPRKVKIVQDFSFST